MPEYDVVGLGNAIVDVIAPVHDSFLLEHHVAKGVMTLIDDGRASHLCTLISNSLESAGGSAANTMGGIASFGGRASFVGKVKSDRLGNAFAQSLNDLGVGFETRMADQGPQTACSIVLVTPDGHRSMNTFLGASRELTADDICETEIAAATILYVEGYLWDAPEAKSAITKAIQAARQAKRQVAFTLSDPFCVARWRNEFRSLLGDLDILFANEEETKSLFETEDFDAAVQSLRTWGGTAILTRSEKGAVIVKGDDVHKIEAAPVAQVVDTTGAGDQFAAGVLFGITQQKTLPQSGWLGALAAAEVISHYGAKPETSLRQLATDAGLL